MHTKNYDSAIAFYRDVFQWETRVEGDSPEFRYTTLTIGEEQYAGIMDGSGFLPRRIPAHWSVYFGADDTDAVPGTVVKLGGTDRGSRRRHPYGRLATAADPNGAQFKFVGPNAG